MTVSWRLWIVSEQRWTSLSYRLTWQTRLLPPLILFGMFLSWLLLPSLVDRALMLVLAYVLFKVLTREATRYRMTSPDIPPSMRL